MSYFEPAEEDTESSKLSDAELRNAVGVVRDVRTQVVRVNGRAIWQAICMSSKERLPPLTEPQLTGISPLVGLDGYEEEQTPSGVIFYHQVWWCRMQ